jgi:hypothetical protein
MRRIVALATAALLLAAAPAAQADDTSVYQAWTGHDSEFEQLGKDLRRHLRSWEKSGYRKGSKAIADVDKTRQTLAQVTSDVNTEQASSPRGGTAKSLALKSNDAFDASLAKLRKAVKLGMAGKRGAMKRALDDADALLARSQRYVKKARTAFKEAGVAVKPA